jgi:hypothetical protein
MFEMRLPITTFEKFPVKKLESLWHVGVVNHLLEAFAFYSGAKSWHCLTRAPRALDVRLRGLNFKCLRWAFLICYPQTAETFRQLLNSSLWGLGVNLLLLTSLTKLVP